MSRAQSLQGFIFQCLLLPESISINRGGIITDTLCFGSAPGRLSMHFPAPSGKDNLIPHLQVICLNCIFALHFKMGMPDSWGSTYCCEPTSEAGCEGLSLPFLRPGVFGRAGSGVHLRVFSQDHYLLAV